MTDRELLNMAEDRGVKVGPSGLLLFGNVFARTLDRPRPGELRGRPITPWAKYPNGAKTVGLNKLLDVAFRNQTQITQWYCGLIAESGYSSESAADTSASHAGWSELTTYTSSTRLAWSPGAASSGTITISSAMSFTTNADSQIRGILIASSSTKSSIVDVLWATATEASARTILSGQTYEVYYTITATPG